MGHKIAESARSDERNISGSEGNNTDIEVEHSASKAEVVVFLTECPVSSKHNADKGLELLQVHKACFCWHD